MDGTFDIGSGGGVAEREPKGTEGRRPIDAHRGEHVRRLHRPARACRCCRGAHVGFVEQEQQCLGLDTGDAHVRRPGDLVLTRHGLGDPVEPISQAVDQLVAQHHQAAVLVDSFAIGEVERYRCSDDAGGVVGAAATFAFLSATDEQRVDLRAATFDEHADTFRTTELVRAERQQIDVGRDVAQVEPARRLDGVGVQQRVGGVTAHDLGDLGDVGDRADLVVDGHHADDRDVWGCIEGGREFVEVDSAESIDADDAALTAAGVSVELFDDVKHCVVFDCRAHGDTASAGDGAGDRHVVALGSAAGEHHLVRMAANDAGDGVAGLVDGLASAASEAVRTRRIGVQLGQVRHHRLDRLGAHRRRGSMVEIGDGRLRHPHHATEGTTRVRPVLSPRAHNLWVVRGYDQRSYGDGFADVYDEWYADVTDVAATVKRMVDIVGVGARVLELGVGTGRLAVPMADAGLQVVAIDSSEAMLTKLAEHDIDRRVDSILGDMIDDLPDGPFDAVLIAYNTIFNLIGDGEQQRLFQQVAARLEPNGAFVVEAFVPDFGPGDGASEVGVRSMAVDHVVLSVSVNRPEEQLAEGQFVQFSESGGVQLRPWSIRWATPEQLDAMATTAGLRLDERVGDMAGVAFTDDSTQHVSVYRRTAAR